MSFLQKTENERNVLPDWDMRAKIKNAQATLKRDALRSLSMRDLSFVLRCSLRPCPDSKMNREGALTNSVLMISGGYDRFHAGTSSLECRRRHG